MGTQYSGGKWSYPNSAQQLAGGGYLSGAPSGSGYTQVGSSGGTPLYYNNGQLYTQATPPGGTGSYGGQSMGEATYIDPTTQQLYGGSKVNAVPYDGGSNTLYTIPGSQPSSIDPYTGREMNPQTISVKPYGVSGGTGDGGTPATYSKWSGDPSKASWNAGVNYSTTAPPRGQSPFESNLFQLNKFTTAQQTEAAKKNLLNNNILGPVQKAIQSGNIDIQGMQGLQTGALSTINDMLTRVLGATTGAYATGVQGANASYGAAGSMLSSSANIYGTIASLQAQAAQANNQGMASGLQGLGSIAGLLFGSSGGSGGGGALGGLSGMFGGASGGAGAAADVASVTSMFQSLPVF